MSVSNLLLNKHNPDVLTCIANLSNDEVFTPPEMAAAMLDLAAEAWARDHNGENLWANPSARVLDPFVKTGVFLREASHRFNDGLASLIPDPQERVNHILTKQIFGIAITELTALMARRSVYCSKYANSEHSICTAFDTPEGNIWFERTEHTWDDKTGRRSAEIDPFTGEEIIVRHGRRCTFCGAGEEDYGRGEDLETHAYAFIHTNNIKQRINEVFGASMHFDLIVGNPPYQLGSAGGTRDIPIYQKFVAQAKELDPQLLTMVIPSRWMATGLGLNEFRQYMLSDRKLSVLVDYQNAAEVFPGVGLNGGACYFLRDATHDGDCEVTTIRGGIASSPTMRRLDEFDILVRDAEALPILRKVLADNPMSINSILARDKEFGWTSNFRDFSVHPQEGLIPIHYIEKMQRKVGYISRAQVTKSVELIDKWKVLVPAVGSGREREKAGVDLVLGPSQIVAAPSVCTQSFLFFYSDTEAEAVSIRSYYSTKFFRFLVSLRKITQHATHSTYSWVPMQSWDREWTDEELYAKYGLSDEEVSYIESLIRPMELD